MSLVFVWPHRLLVAVMAAALALVATSAVQAEETPPASVLELEEEAREPAADMLLRGRVLRTTAMLTGSARVDVPSLTIHPIHDPVILFCPGDTAGPCTIEAQIFAQVRAPGGNKYALCTRVDGVYLQPSGCPFLGELQPNVWTGNSFTSVLPGVRRGRRTVQSFVYLDSPGTLANWSVVYNVYKPN